MDKTCQQCGNKYRGQGDKFCSQACMAMSYRNTDVQSAFWQHVDKNGPGGCWVWKSYRNERGYGLMTFNRRKNIRAHRFSWELVHGPTPSHKFCLHNCDNRRCVNPEHLYLGSYAENARDVQLRGRQVSKLTANQVLEIRASTESNQALAPKYGVSYRTIWAVRNAKGKWKYADVSKPEKSKRRWQRLGQY